MMFKKKKGLDHFNHELKENRMTRAAVCVCLDLGSSHFFIFPWASELNSCIIKYFLLKGSTGLYNDIISSHFRVEHLDNKCPICAGHSIGYNYCTNHM